MNWTAARYAGYLEPGKRAKVREYAGYEPHPVVVIQDDGEELVIRCDQ